MHGENHRERNNTRRKREKLRINCSESFVHFTLWRTRTFLENQKRQKFESWSVKDDTELKSTIFSSIACHPAECLWENFQTNFQIVNLERQLQASATTLLKLAYIFRTKRRLSQPPWYQQPQSLGINFAALRDLSMVRCRFPRRVSIRKARRDKSLAYH